MENSGLLNQVLLQFGDEFDPLHENLSAALLTPDRHLWLGSDETSTLERLSPIDSRTFASHKQFQVAEFIELPAAADAEIDIEGLAYFDYYLWLVGSHSRKRKKAKKDKTDIENLHRLATVENEANRYILARIPLVNGELLQSCPHPDRGASLLTAAKLALSDRGNVLMDALESDPHLGPFILSGLPSKDNGFDIEGLAVCNDKIFIGLRGPVLRGWAILLQIEVKPTSSTVFDLKKIGDSAQRYKKYFVKLQGLGIRDLCFDGEDLLILAGPTMDLDGPSKVFRLKNGMNWPDNALLWKPEFVLNLPYGEGDRHAEGMTGFAGINGRPSILVVYDSPAPSQILQESTGVLADIFEIG